MSRSEVVHRMNDLLEEIAAAKSLPMATTQAGKVLIAALERHRDDLQRIYNQHLYKLP